jgi:hypothetical protein
MIRKVKGGWAIFSHKTGKKLSRTYKKKEEAKRRLDQIRWFKKQSH